MRIHPAVAAAMVVVGGVLIAIPAMQWGNHAPSYPTKDTMSVAPMISALTALCGGILVLTAVVFSFETKQQKN